MTAYGYLTPKHLQLIRNQAERITENEKLGLTKAEALSILDTIDLATETLEEVYDHYTPGSPGNGDTPSSAWMEVRFALDKLGRKPPL